VSAAAASADSEGARGELVIVTGSSHVGKSTLIRGLQSRADRPAAHVSIDEAIEGLDLEVEDRWEHGLHLAYEKAAAEAGELLGRGELVLFESTFTYVPPDNRPAQFHLHELERLIDLAAGLGTRVVVVHLFASLDDVAARRVETGRLTEEIVRITWQQHAGRRLSHPELLQIDTSQLSPTEVVDQVWAKLAGRAGSA